MVKHVNSNSNSQPESQNRGSRVRRYYAGNSVVTAGQAINNSSSNVNVNNKISSHFQYVSSANNSNNAAGSAGILTSDPTSPQASSSSASSTSASNYNNLSPINVHLIDHGYGTPIGQHHQQQQQVVTQSKQESQITNYYKVGSNF